jgi:adenylate cyclase
MSRWRERLGVTALCFGIAVAVAVFRLATPGFAVQGTLMSGWAPLELLELKALDLRFKLRGPRAPSGDVVIVGVDEPSLARYGRWPWPRARLGELVTKLTAAGARTIAFDAVFDQPDPTGDAAFAAALRASGRVVLGEFFEFGDAPGAPHPVFPEIPLRDRGGGGAKLRAASGFHGPVPSLEAAAADAGHVNVFPDSDGGFRRVPLVVRLEDRTAPALAVAVLRQYLGAGDALVTVGGPGDTALRLAGRELPIDEAGDLRIDFLGPTGTVPEVSALDVLTGKPLATPLAGRIALVAATVVGSDSRPTPFSGAAPGVEVHASLIDNLLRGRGLVRPPWLVPVEAALIVVLGGATGLLIRWRAILGAVLALALYPAYFGASQLAFTSRGVVLALVYPGAAVLSATLAGLFYRYFFEERERRNTQRALTHYVGAEIAVMLADSPERLRLGGERREISILFTDIRGFSTIAERLPPVELAELLTEHLGAQTDVVFRHGGYLDKYIGDAVMAFWNAPHDVEDHARRACLAALDIVKALPPLQARWQARGWPLVEMGIGIDTGEAIVGNFGSTLSERFNYTAISDHVNTASRLEGLNKVYGSCILVTEHTRELVGDEFVCRELDCVRVKGKTHPVTVYELLTRRVDDAGGKLAHVAGAFQQAYMAYRRRRFKDAIVALEAVAEGRADDVTIPRFIARCRALMADPPGPGWDGVYEAVSK